MMRASFGAIVLFGVVVTAACGGGNTPPQGGETAPGAERTAKTAALETGANLMHAKAPVEKIAMYLNGFHVSKDDPKMQMEAHHYCNQANEDLAQCVLFDGNTAEARMMGIEYIISEKLYNTLPADEKACGWAICRLRVGLPADACSHSRRHPVQRSPWLSDAGSRFRDTIT